MRYYNVLYKEDDELVSLRLPMKHFFLSNENGALYIRDERLGDDIINFIDNSNLTMIIPHTSLVVIKVEGIEDLDDD